MRIAILLLCFLLPSRAWCQQPFLLMPPVTDDTAKAADEEGEASGGYGLHYYAGISLYEKGLYAAAERELRNAYAVRHTEEAATALYYALLYQGEDLQAAAFRKRNPRYTFALPPYRKGLESFYADGGVRLSATESAGNIPLWEGGAFFRVGSQWRLWQSLAYLQQDRNLGSYKQYESFTSLTGYLGRRWTIAPSVHYDYVPYTTQLQQSDSVSYSAAYVEHRNDTLFYRTRALQQVEQTIPGFIHFLNLAVSLSRRAGPVTVYAEPAFHYMPGRGTITTQYHTAGITDSFEDNRLRGSRPFRDSGTSVSDTSMRYSSWQLGAGVVWRPSITGSPLTLRASVYYLWDGEGTNAFAYNLYAMLWWKKDFRLFFNWIGKGDLPLSLPYSGQYLNYNDVIGARTSVAVQLFPLKHFSPILTYQYEQDTRQQDGATLIYHSIYLTLKYNL